MKRHMCGKCLDGHIFWTERGWARHMRKVHGITWWFEPAVKAMIDTALDPDLTPIPEPGSHRIDLPHTGHSSSGDRIA